MLLGIRREAIKLAFGDSTKAASDNAVADQNAAGSSACGWATVGLFAKTVSAVISFPLWELGILTPPGLPVLESVVLLRSQTFYTNLNNDISNLLCRR